MQFQVRTSAPKPDEELVSIGILVRDNWDDWSKYRTQFYLIVFDHNGTKFDIGDVKIGQRGLKPSAFVKKGYRAPELAQDFIVLESDYFSLGQGETYYENLQTMQSSVAEEVLIGLNDCAYNIEIFNLHQNEDVMNESLLRFISKSNVLGRLNRLANGDAKLTPYHFEYAFAEPVPGIPGTKIDFRVKPYNRPPTSVHVIIGRNGVGKTRFLQSFANAIVNPKGDYRKVGDLVLHDEILEPWSFSGLVYVSFSAFDDYKLPQPADIELKAAQVSLSGDTSIADKDGETTKAGVKQFTSSLARCRRGTRKRRWREAITALASDPLFEEAQISELIDLPEKTWKKKASDLFEKLSSGHAVVLLTITRLVELVDEYTIVLMDEPEGHLHPPLLSALIRSLSDLLTRRNGVAIIATHSPVVLQEVPKSCVWKLRRAGITAVAERPELETFGENVGTLTAEVFGLEVTSSGFHKLLNDAVKTQEGNYEAVLDYFDDQLGAEARAIVRGLSAVYNQNKAS